MTSSRKSVARIAGLLYLVALIPAPFSLIYIPRTLIVPKDAAATSARILASESLFRLGIAGELINAIAFFFVVLALHRLLRPVHRWLASLMVTLFAISIPISFVNVLNDMAALILLRGADFLSAFTRPQLDALAMVFLRLHGEGLVVTSIFWGLWLLPFGLLVYRSGFLPRILGVLLVVNGFAYVIPSFITVWLPQYRDAASRLALPFLLAELAMWLLIRGAKQGTIAQTAA
ncbi:MAG: DUF4386 domain-containing protein [Acidobacteriota bacterium]